LSNSLPSDFVFLKETFDKIGERNNREDFNPLTYKFLTGGWVFLYS